MKKVIEYKTVAGSSLENLDESLAEALSEGYQPFGNMVFCQNAPSVWEEDEEDINHGKYDYFVQVVVKYED